MIQKVMSNRMVTDKVLLVALIVTLCASAGTVRHLKTIYGLNLHNDLILYRVLLREYITL